MLKLKEEFDYKSLSRRLDIQLDKVIAEHERQRKACEDEIERVTVEAQNQISNAERNYADALEVSVYVDIYIATNHMLETYVHMLTLGYLNILHCILRIN